MHKRLIIIDISNFIFRAFFAIRPLTAPDGTPVNAVHGVLSMLLKIFSVYRPTHVFIARDTAGGTFRNELYPEYKANRSEPPEDLVPQFDLIKKLIQKMEVPCFEHQDFEADDIIGSACTQWKNDFDEILIASGDKDLMQFVDGPIKMLDTMKDKIYDADAVFEKMGVRPEQIVDYLSIVGDSSDNVPGMKGIGAKGAAKLLEDYGTLENCIAHKDEMKGKRIINAFENHLDDALLSKKLIQIVTDMDIGHKPTETEYRFYPTDELIQFMEELNFKSFIKKLNEMKLAEHRAAASDNHDEPSFVDLVQEIETFSFEHVVVTKDNFKDVLEQIRACSALSLHTEYTSEDLFERRVLGLSVSMDEKKSFYFPFKHTEGENLTKEQLFEVLDLTWGNENVEICSEHTKRDLSHAIQIERSFIAQRFDITQAHYVVDSNGKHGIADQSLFYFEHELFKIDTKSNILTEFPIEDVAKFAGERACMTLKLTSKLKDELERLELGKIYYELDDLLIPILARMEKEGIYIDVDFFKKMEVELAEQLDVIQRKIDKHSEKPVNLNSPKQVGQLLFEELALPVVKKTKTGFSTDSEVLEDLDSRNVSEVPGLILQYRELGKLHSTYVKALPELINPHDKRLHTNFNQHVAATGRLSSVNPNLQNIPMRTELGRRIRKGFLPKEGFKLLGADYSQVELRILAHFSGDQTMIKAFNDGIDIHSQTASEVLGVDVTNVTSEERSKAKAVNFGLMYGQSSFGLAKALKISRSDAKDYITRYFERFSKVKSYLDELKEFAEQNGYSQTLFGRKRFLPDIHSKNRTIKANAERIAVNSPIQGTAADIIKMAMIQIQSDLDKNNLQTRMLLQVHDELIFEVPEDEIDQVSSIVRQGMENVVELEVPLAVDMGVGSNWYDLK
ncbi:MAG: DNA polymerase I [Deltaproteobacteria bacterium]|nr:MAG: DNA polymerase I [Deltaproteobacteria bacterium]